MISRITCPHIDLFQVLGLQEYKAHPELEGTLYSNLECTKLKVTLDATFKKDKIAKFFTEKIKDKIPGFSDEYKELKKWKAVFFIHGEIKEALIEANPKFKELNQRGQIKEQQKICSYILYNKDIPPEQQRRVDYVKGGSMNVFFDPEETKYVHDGMTRVEEKRPHFIHMDNPKLQEDSKLSQIRNLEHAINHVNQVLK